MSSRKTNTVLVTGGSGFVGSAVVTGLLARKHEVVATSNVLTEAMTEHPGLSWVLWDALVEPLPKIDWARLDTVLHLAMPERLFDFPEGAVPVYELGVASTFRLLEAARRHGVRRLAVASTGNVLGACGGPARETNLLYLPLSFYGTAKACMELLVRGYEPILSTAILRFYHPYGPGGDRFLVNRLVRLVAEGKEITIEGADGILLNPVWVEEMAEGVCAAVVSDAAGVFHFGGPDVLTLRRLIELIGSTALINW